MYKCTYSYTHPYLQTSWYIGWKFVELDTRGRLFFQTDHVQRMPVSSNICWFQIVLNQISQATGQMCSWKVIIRYYLYIEVILPRHVLTAKGIVLSLELQKAQAKTSQEPRIPMARFQCWWYWVNSILLPQHFTFLGEMLHNKLCRNLNMNAHKTWALPCPPRQLFGPVRMMKIYNESWPPCTGVMPFVLSRRKKSSWCKTMAFQVGRPQLRGRNKWIQIQHGKNSSDI